MNRRALTLLELLVAVAILVSMTTLKLARAAHKLSQNKVELNGHSRYNYK